MCLIYICPGCDHKSPFSPFKKKKKQPTPFAPKSFDKTSRNPITKISRRKARRSYHLSHPPIPFEENPQENNNKTAKHLERKQKPLLNDHLNKLKDFEAKEEREREKRNNLQNE